MAYKKLSDGTYHSISPTEGARIWQVLMCEIAPLSDTDADAISQVADVILNKRSPDTPLSYKQAYRSRSSPTDGTDYASVLGVRV